MTSIIPRERQERMHLHKGYWCQDEHANRTERLIQPETRNTRQRPKQDNATQLHPNVTTRPETDKKENYTIKDTWTNLIQAEDYLLRGITAFLPRIQQEETNPTFEHPEDWDCLNLQEKANLFIFDNIIKDDQVRFLLKVKAVPIFWVLKGRIRLFVVSLGGMP